MKLHSKSLSPNEPIPEEYAFGKHDPAAHFALSGNRSPDLSWSDLPSGTRSLVLVCVDPDAPSRPDDVNQEGRSVPYDLPRADFHHWAMVDVPPSCAGVAAGECSDGVTAGGKEDPPGPEGCRQGLNDYTSWFAADAQMKGEYRGYDGPAPPWNDERAHRYRFTVYATDLERCPVEGAFRAPDVLAAIEGHVLAEASITGTYAINPDAR